MFLEQRFLNCGTNVTGGTLQSGVQKWQLPILSAQIKCLQQAVPLLGGLPCFAAVTWELLSLQPERCVPCCHPAQDLVGRKADSCRWSWAAPPRR